MLLKQNIWADILVLFHICADIVLRITINKCDSENHDGVSGAKQEYFTQVSWKK